MGTSAYLGWDGMTEEERAAQEGDDWATGWATGWKGAIHDLDGRNAVSAMLPEGYAEGVGPLTPTRVPAETMMRRLPMALRISYDRHGPDVERDLMIVAFVHRALTAEITGLEPNVWVSWR